MPSLPKGQRHPDELRERAIRMVLDHAHEYPSPVRLHTASRGRARVATVVCPSSQ